MSGLNVVGNRVANTRRLAYRSATRGRKPACFRLSYPWDRYAKPSGPWVVAHFDCRTYDYHPTFDDALNACNKHLCRHS